MQFQFRSFLPSFFLDGDEEPPPDPAPPEVPPRGHSMQTMKKRPDFVLTIDKNGDQKHEEYIPSHQQGRFIFHVSS